MPKLSHHESHVLALVLKWQPTTAYFIRKALERGLASTFSSSPGSVYPAIERFKKRGLIVATAIEDDGRRTEQLTCTQAGIAAVREWIVSVEPSDALPEDPWRTRMAMADALEREERLSWLLLLRSEAEQQQSALSDRAALDAGECQMAALEHARIMTDGRLAWIDRTIARMVKEPLAASASPRSAPPSRPARDHTPGRPDTGGARDGSDAPRD